MTEVVGSLHTPEARAIAFVDDMPSTCETARRAGGLLDALAVGLAARVALGFG
jgi:hypothetical protein